MNNQTSSSTNQFTANINEILFLILTCVSIPSVCINLFAIYRLQPNTKLSVFVFRCVLHVSLFTTLTCLPIFLVELHFHSHFPLPLTVCKIWLITDYSSTVCLGLLFSWASIQRHILIFGPIHIKKLQSTLKYKLVPCLFILAFPLTWYSILILPCDYQEIHLQCRPCFEGKKLLFLIDTLLSLLLPLLITILATFILLVRILTLRRRLFRSNSKKWRRCKRLTRQMLLFSSIYSIGLLPYVINNFNSLYHFWPLIEFSSSEQIANAFTYVPCCFSSFLSIYAFPEIWRNHRSRHGNQQNSFRATRKPRNTSMSSSTET